MSSNIKISLKTRVIRFMLTSSAILLADLMITSINKKVLELKEAYNIHLVTLIAMIVILLLFYIMFINLNKISEWAVNRFVQIGRRWMGRRIGLYATFSILFFFLYSGYYWVWFNQNLLNELLKNLKKIISWPLSFYLVVRWSGKFSETSIFL